MISKDEALKLALKALEPDVYTAEWVVQEDIQKAINAIKMVTTYKGYLYVAEGGDGVQRFYRHYSYIPTSFKVWGKIKLEAVE